MGNILKSHLKPNGVVYYNTTQSEDVIYTAASVFRHILLYDGFIAVSDEPFDMSEQEVWGHFQEFKKEPVLAMFKSRFHLYEFEELAAKQLVDIGADYRNRSDLELITDDNMATEFRRKSPKTGVTWTSFLKKVWISS